MINLESGFYFNVGNQFIIDTFLKGILYILFYSQSHSGDEQQLPYS